MGAPTGTPNWSDPFWSSPAPAPAPPPPPPPPPPPAAANPRYEQLTSAGGSSMFGNNMTKDAGRKREAEMRAAEAALIVAQSHASRGETTEAQTAYNESVKRAADAQNFGTGPMPGFTSGFNSALQQTFPEGRPTPAPPPEKTDPGPGPRPGPGPGPGSGSGSGGGATSASPPPPSPSPPPPVKIPDRDVLNFTRNNISATGITTLLFENIGGVEISTLTRRDTVEGQNPYYSLISNLSTIKTQYDPTQLISRQKPNQTLFDVFPIDLNSKIPGDPYLLQRNLENFFYIASNGDFVIELDNLLQDENIQLEIAGSGTIKMVNGS